MLTRGQIAAVEATHDIGYLVDAPHRGAPLVVSFGYVSWHAPGQFDFVGRIRKLAASGRPINLLLVRDTANLWYQHGVPGLGGDVETTAAALRRWIDWLGPSSVSMIGQSMGAYGAILFGALAGADRVLAFGPMAHLRGDWAQEEGDLRRIDDIRKLERHPPPKLHDDLTATLDGCRRRPAIHIVFGSGPDLLPNADAVHARRLSRFAEVSLEQYDEAPHAVVRWLVDRGLIDGVIARHLLAEPADPRAGIARPPPDLPGDLDPSRSLDEARRGWIAESLLLGRAEADLLAELVGQGHHVGEVQRALYAVARSPVLAAARRLIDQGVASRSSSA